MENDERWMFEVKGTPCNLLPILHSLIRFGRPWKDTIFKEEPNILQDEGVVAGDAQAAPGAATGDGADSEELSDEEMEGEDEDERQRRPSRPSRTGGEKRVRDPSEVNTVGHLDHTARMLQQEKRQRSQVFWATEAAIRVEEVRSGTLYLVQIDEVEGELKLGLAELTGA